MSYWLPDYEYPVTPIPSDAAQVLAQAGIVAEAIYLIDGSIDRQAPGALRIMVADDVSKDAVDAALAHYNPVHGLPRPLAERAAYTQQLRTNPPKVGDVHA